MLYKEFYEINVFNIASGYFINKCGQIITTRDNHCLYKLLSIKEDKDGYLETQLVCNDGKRRHFRIHRLVCAMWNGEPNKTSFVAMHKDNNKKNNIPSNLEWGSIAKNTQDAYKDKLCSCSTKIKAIDSQGNLIEFYSTQDFGRYIGCSVGYAGQLLNNLINRPGFTSKKYPKANDLQILQYYK